jgi:hypothetical protein
MKVEEDLFSIFHYDTFRSIINEGMSWDFACVSGQLFDRL